MPAAPAEAVFAPICANLPNSRQTLAALPRLGRSAVPSGGALGPLGRAERRRALGRHIAVALVLPACGGDCTTGVSCGGQQLQAQGGQVWPSVHAGQAQPQPLGGGGFVVPRAQVPVGHGAVTHSMLSDVQTQESPVSAAHVLASV
jgi:hypothetical protein